MNWGAPIACTQHQLSACSSAPLHAHICLAKLLLQAASGLGMHARFATSPGRLCGVAPVVRGSGMGKEDSNTGLFHKEGIVQKAV